MAVSILKMSAGVFEPLFFLGLLWCIIQLPFVCRSLIRREVSLRCSLLLCTMLVIVWRSGVKLWSGRYASILIIMMTLWCVDACRAFAESKFLKRWHLGSAIGLLIFATLIYACIAKNLRINRHANYIIDCAELIRKDAQDHPGAVIWSYHNAPRMEYYSKLPAISNFELVADDFDSCSLERFIDQYKYCGYPIYMILTEPGKGGAVTAKALGLQKSQWRFLGSFYKNNKEKNSACVYFLDGRCGITPASETVIADYCRKYSSHVVKNGRFEHAMTEAQQKSFSAQARGIGLPFWADGALHPFPKDWSIFQNTPIRDKKCEIELTTEALEGSYSLRIKSDDLVSAFTAGMFPAGDCEIGFLACGTPGGKFELRLHLYDGKSKWLGYPRLAVFLADGKPRLYRVTVKKGALKNAAYYKLCPTVKKGEVRFDAFSVRPLAGADAGIAI